MPAEASHTADLDARRYVVSVLTGIWLLGLLVVALNILVNPYDIFPVPDLGLRKTRAASLVRIVKPNQVARTGPATIVIGSSVPLVGIDPDSPAWQPAHRPVYNFGIDGAGPSLQQHLVRHSLAVASPRLFVVLLSYQDAAGYTPGPDLALQSSNDATLADRLKVTADGQDNTDFAVAHIADLMVATLTARAAVDSVRTLIEQWTAPGEDLSAHGFERRQSLDDALRDAGTQAVFRRRHEGMAPRLVWWMRQPEWPYDSLEALIRAARAGGADVRIALAPGHVEQIELQRRVGLLPRVMDWRTRIAALVDAQAAHAGGPEHVALWDFQALTPFTTESVDRAGPAGLRWFWDTSHFRPDLGARIVARMEGTRPEDGFGTRLTSATVAAANADLLRALDTWERTEPAAVARIASIADRAPAELCRTVAASCTPPAQTVALGRLP